MLVSNKNWPKRAKKRHDFFLSIQYKKGMGPEFDPHRLHDFSLKKFQCKAKIEGM